MNWFKRKHQEVVPPETFALFLLKITQDTVNDTCQTLKKHLDASEHSKFPKVQEELIYFFVFALDYWWAQESKRTLEERQIVRQAFADHLANIVNIDTLHERLIAYAKIANEEQGDNAMFFGFGKELSRYCGMPQIRLHLLALAPALFTEALEYLGTLKPVKLKF